MKDLEAVKLSNNWKRLLEYRTQKVLGIQTGIDGLDKMLLGLGNLTTLQGCTGLGKSTLALQIAVHNMLKGYPCLLFDFENGFPRIQSRILCMINKVSETVIKTCSIEKLKEYREPVKELPLYVYNEKTIDFELIEHRLDEVFKLIDKKTPVLWIIDSVQSLGRIAADDRLSLEAWFIFLDEMKLKYKGYLTIIAVSEKNRASYGESGLGKGKGSNTLEYKAECVLDLVENESGDLSIRICKQRDGIGKGSVNVMRELMQPDNLRSFTFNLIEREDLRV